MELRIVNVVLVEPQIVSINTENSTCFSVTNDYEEDDTNLNANSLYFKLNNGEETGNNVKFDERD